MQAIDLIAEGARARELLSEPGLDTELRNIISQSILGQVLLALWNSGFYEYALGHRRFTASAAAAELKLDPMVFASLTEYLLGRGLLELDDTQLGLTERGRKLHNVLARGLVDLYLGGYNDLLRNLGPLLRKDVTLDDPRLDRSVPHAAAGTEELTCISVVPRVIEELKQAGVNVVLDLGSGTGGFLIQWARSGPQLSGLGVDLSASAVAQAGTNAVAQGVGERLTFHVGEVGAGLLPLPEDLVSRVDAVTAMYMLHEMGRRGRQAIVEVIGQLKAQFGGKRLFFLEMIPADAVAMGKDPPADYMLLDYLFVHPLSRQGRPLTPSAWEAIVQDAGATPLARKKLAGGMLYLYQVQL